MITPSILDRKTHQCVYLESAQNKNPFVDHMPTTHTFLFRIQCAEAMRVWKSWLSLGTPKRRDRVVVHQLDGLIKWKTHRPPNSMRSWETRWIETGGGRSSAPDVTPMLTTILGYEGQTIERERTIDPIFRILFSYDYINYLFLIF